jgi:hypothetical protein
VKRVRAAATCRLPSSTRRGLAGAASAVRVLTAVALMSTALLIVALVQQGVRAPASAASQPGGSGNLADLLRAAARPDRAGAQAPPTLPSGASGRDRRW